MRIDQSSAFKYLIIFFGAIGCFLGFMGSSLASDLSSKNLLSVNIKALIGYGASSIGVLGIFISYAENRLGAYVLIASVALGMFSVSALFLGAAFFYLSSAIICFKNTSN